MMQRGQLGGGGGGGQLEGGMGEGGVRLIAKVTCVQTQLGNTDASFRTKSLTQKHSQVYWYANKARVSYFA